jgi:hypothetical protein
MILHASVVADRPRETAEILAILLGGVALPVGPGEGTWTAIGPDPVGNLVSVLARGSEFHRVAGGHPETRLGNPTRHTGFHLLIETGLGEQEVLELARERDCQAQRASHGAFEVIEFWIDDCLLIELATPELGHVYRETIASEDLQERIAPIVAAGLAASARASPFRVTAACNSTMGAALGSIIAIIMSHHIENMRSA